MQTVRAMLLSTPIVVVYTNQQIGSRDKATVLANRNADSKTTEDTWPY